MVRHLFLNTLFLSCVLFAASESEATQLQNSLEKYKNTTISDHSLKRLSPYNHFIDYYSQFTFFRPRHKVNPDFIRALILAESNATPRAVSSKGALGLGQIIFTTGKQAAKELSRSPYTFRHVSRETLANLKKEDLFEPEVNILLTCYLISKYNYKFNGRLELVITAWNAGENLAILHQGLPAPYKETQNLIGKVNSFYIDLIQKRNRMLVTQKN